MFSQIDAAFYPHVIDIVLEAFVDCNHDASDLRLVSKDWKDKVDRLLARSVEIREFKLSLPGMSDEYGWSVRSWSRPSVHYGFTPGTIQTMVRVQRMCPIGSLRPSNLHEVVRFVDLKAAHLAWVEAGSVFDRLAGLHTIRIPKALGVRYLGAFAHIDRVVYAHVPRVPASSRYAEFCACRGRRADACPRPHTRKIVVNQRAPDWESPGSALWTAPGLQHVVLIMHPWRTDAGIHERLQAWPEPRLGVLSFAAHAMHVGARVTIVNPAQLDFRTHAPRGDFPLRRRHRMHIFRMTHDEAAEDLRSLVAACTVRWEPPESRGISGDDWERLRILTTAEYVAEVGRVQFEIEAGLR